MASIRGVLLALAMIALTGCQMLSVRSSPPVPPLLEPASGGMAVQLNQRLTLIVDGLRHHIISVVSITPEQTRMTGFTLTGQRLLDIVHENGKISAWQSEQVARDMPARWLLAQLQLAYWPEAALQEAYGSPWKVSQIGPQRALHLEGELEVVISYSAKFHAPETGAELTINHPRMGLVMAIKTLKMKDLAAQ
ncbi:MAG: DUF3261 domain-containing protein [Marinobacter sp.]|uniref:DUF3261 domain-containing protein n=1 Tax=Marinobacter sp. TaxID=50741 RepID=UPI003F9BBFDA